ncbi:MAG TPA: hypothetical protein VGM88_34400 [Kofleriaceae bacterium]|jgi:predicted amidohydrolase
MTLALVAVQLRVTATAVASAEAYRAHVWAAVEDALVDAGDAAHKVVVLPELAGHLALLALAPPAAHRARTLGAALNTAAVRRPLDILRGMATARVLGSRAAVLAALAPDGERFWRSVCGPLAKRAGAWLVAGSHVRLGATGDLTSSSLLFDPEGRCAAVTDKVNLVPGIEDGAPGALGLSRGEPKLPLTEAPFGTIATLIGYDACPEASSVHDRFTPLHETFTATVVANPTAASRGLPDAMRAAPVARYGILAQLECDVLDLAYEGAAAVYERVGAEVHARGPVLRVSP